MGLENSVNDNEIGWTPPSKISFADATLPGVLTSRTVSREHWKRHPLETAKMVGATLLLPLTINTYLGLVGYLLYTGVDYLLS